MFPGGAKLPPVETCSFNILSISLELAKNVTENVTDSRTWPTHQNHVKSSDKCILPGLALTHCIRTSGEEAWDSVFLTDFPGDSLQPAKPQTIHHYLGAMVLGQTDTALVTSFTFTKVVENCHVFQLPSILGTTAFLH